MVDNFLSSYKQLVGPLITEELKAQNNSESIQTEKKYLSGTVKDNTVEWDFYCSD